MLSRRVSTQPYHDKYKKMRFGNIKLRKVVLMILITKEEYEFENTIEAGIWYKQNTGSLANIPNLTNMMMRVAKGDRKHIGNFYVFVEGVNL